MNENSPTKAVSGYKQKLLGRSLQRLMARLEFQFCEETGILQVHRLIPLSWASFSLLEQPFLVQLASELTPCNNKFKDLLEAVNLAEQ